MSIDTTTCIELTQASRPRGRASIFDFNPESPVMNSLIITPNRPGILARRNQGAIEMKLHYHDRDRASFTLRPFGRDVEEKDYLLELPMDRTNTLQVASFDDFYSVSRVNPFGMGNTFSLRYAGMPTKRNHHPDVAQVEFYLLGALYKIDRR